jgi:hypothetical protein
MLTDIGVQYQLRRGKGSGSSTQWEGNRNLCRGLGVRRLGDRGGWLSIEPHARDAVTHSRAVGHWSSSVDRFVVISGCSSAGKSTLIAELGRRGYAVVDEPGRRIVKEELARGGSALPWVDGVAFARRAMEIALADRAAAGSLDGWVFFDRGLIDAAWPSGRS